MKKISLMITAICVLAVVGVATIIIVNPRNEMLEKCKAAHGVAVRKFYSDGMICIQESAVIP